MVSAATFLTIKKPAFIFIASGFLNKIRDIFLTFITAFLFYLVFPEARVLGRKKQFYATAMSDAYAYNLQYRVDVSQQWQNQSSTFSIVLEKRGR